MFGKLKDYFNWERKSLRTAQDLVSRSNRAMLIMLLSALVAVNFGILVVGLLQSRYSSFQAFTGFMCGYMLVCLLLVVRIPSLPAIHLLYGVQLVSVFLCLHASAFVDPDYINAEAYVFFLLFPILCIDLSPRIDGITLSLLIVYLVNIFQYKSEKALVLEASTLVGFTMVGLALGHFVRYWVLKALLQLEKSARAELHERMLGLPNHKGLMQNVATLPTTPQAVVCIHIDELHSPAASFGIHYDERQLRALGDALRAAGEAQGIGLYCCGSEILGMVQPRVLEGVFQRLEPVYNALSGFTFRRADGGEVKLHFGIGAALCELDDVEAALRRAAEACVAAHKDGKNRIMM